MNFQKMITVVTLTILLGCRDGNEKQLVEMLNQNEKTFNKNKFELVNYTLVDTLYETNRVDLISSKLKNFTEVRENTLVFNDEHIIEIPDSSEPYIPSYYEWREGLYSTQLYDHIVKHNFIDEYGVPSRVLNASNYRGNEDFGKIMLTDLTLRKLFIDAAKGYDEFKGAFHPDSITHYLILEKEASSKIIGYVYKLKYRSNNVLTQKTVITDSKTGDIVLYWNSN